MKCPTTYKLIGKQISNIRMWHMNLGLWCISLVLKTIGSADFFMIIIYSYIKKTNVE